MAWKERAKVAKIIKQLSDESGIPFKNLERWYYDLAKNLIKNEEASLGLDEDTDSGINPPNEFEVNELCSICITRAM